MTIDLTTDSDTKRVTETPSKSEIEKLEDMIRKQHPEWNITVEPFFEGQKLTLCRHDKFICDVVCHHYSYGGKEGLLEWWDCKKGTDPVGWLSAEEALELFEASLKKKAGQIIALWTATGKWEKEKLKDERKLLEAT